MISYSCVESHRSFILIPTPGYDASLLGKLGPPLPCSTRSSLAGFPPDHDVGPSGNRLVSVFVYLSGCPKGGETQFHMLDLAVSPVCGNALIWLNIDKRNQLDGRTLHSGCPVLEGEKWGMNWH